MKTVLLSADNEISVFSVPDEVADHLDAYCQEFCCRWLYKSPAAAKYRVPMGDAVGVRYDEKDFIAYLDRFVCAEPSAWVATLAGVYSAEELPEEYRGLPYFNF